MEESSGGLPELPQSPISSPRGLVDPVSPDTSFLVLPGKGVSSDSKEDPGPEGPQYPVNMVAERSRSDEEIAKI
eukprot:4437062-Karenia_brevis.AAC.1